MVKNLFFYRRDHQMTKLFYVFPFIGLLLSFSILFAQDMPHEGLSNEPSIPPIELEASKDGIAAILFEALNSYYEKRQGQEVALMLPIYRDQFSNDSIRIQVGPQQKMRGLMVVQTKTAEGYFYTMQVAFRTGHMEIDPLSFSGILFSALKEWVDIKKQEGYIPENLRELTGKTQGYILYDLDAPAQLVISSAADEEGKTSQYGVQFSWLKQPGRPKEIKYNESVYKILLNDQIRNDLFRKFTEQGVEDPVLSVVTHRVPVLAGGAVSSSVIYDLWFEPFDVREETEGKVVHLSVEIKQGETLQETLIRKWNLETFSQTAGNAFSRFAEEDENVLSFEEEEKLLEMKSDAQAKKVSLRGFIFPPGEGRTEVEVDPAVSGILLSTEFDEALYKIRERVENGTILLSRVSKMAPGDAQKNRGITDIYQFDAIIPELPKATVSFYEIPIIATNQLCNTLTSEGTLMMRPYIDVRDVGTNMSLPFESTSAVQRPHVRVTDPDEVKSQAVFQDGDLDAIRQYIASKIDDQKFWEETVPKLLRDPSSFVRGPVAYALRFKADLPEAVQYEIPFLLKGDDSTIRTMVDTLRFQKKWPEAVWPELLNLIKANDVSLNKSIVAAVQSQKNWPQEFLQGLERLKDIRRPSVQATVGLLLNARPGTGPDTCESFFEGA